MRIILLNRFYWPDEPATAQLLTDLAEALAARGHDVNVITGPSSAPGADAIERNGVRIHRVRGTRWGRRSLAGRAVDFITFLRGAGATLARLAQPGDAVVAMTDPPLLGIACSRATRRSGVRLWHWTQDIYPEVAMAVSANPLSRVLAGSLRGPRNRAWRYSAGCVVLGREMAALVANAGVEPQRITTIPNWAPAGVAGSHEAGARALRQAWGLDASFVVGYSGNLGRVHDLDPILNVAELLRAESKIAFVFIGDGAQRPGLQAQTQRRGLIHVHFQSAQPREKLGAVLAAPDVHLVTLRQGCEALVFPSKLYGIAAAGRPAIFIGPPACEIAETVVNRGLGYSFAPESVSTIAAAIRTLAADRNKCAAMGRASLEFARSSGGAAAAAESWHRLLTTT